MSSTFLGRFGRAVEMEAFQEIRSAALENRSFCYPLTLWKEKNDRIFKNTSCEELMMKQFIGFKFDDVLSS